MIKSDSVYLFDNNGPIADRMDGYEQRPQQIRMVEAVEEAINSQSNLLIEAGTGVGKSLAYLVPFVYWAVENNKKVVVSTYTKALQSQLYIKDLPFLRRVMDIDFNYSLCLGSENYVCRRKAERAKQAKAFKSGKLNGEMERINEWLEYTESGIFSDLDFIPSKKVRERFYRESDLCRGRKCAFADSCFHRKSKIRQSNSHVLVTNHALLFSNLISESKVLPDFHGMVLDEAHTLEDVATGYFGREAGNGSLEYILDSVDRLIIRKEVKELDSWGIIDVIDGIKSTSSRLRSLSKDFFSEVGNVFGSEEGVFKLGHEETVIYPDFDDAILELSELLLDLNRIIKNSDQEDGFSDNADRARAYADRCTGFLEALQFCLSHEDDRYVYWVDIRKKAGTASYSFHAAPIDISEHMREYIFDNICPVVLTSATISSGAGKKDFEYFKERLGVGDAEEIILSSPYDYKKNVMLYLPDKIADPNSAFSVYKDNIKDQIMKIYEIMGGRIFVLFTSYDMLNAISSELLSERPDMNLLVQGRLPRYVLLDTFKTNSDSVLMGTSTFWQGVDVPGKALECVVITKLPFTVPSDPVNSARIKCLNDRGKNAFVQYQLPQAIITFKQGFGRLIRSASDRGVVAVLDPRIKTRRYGGNFLNSLPDCTITDQISDVEGFFPMS